MKNLYFVFIACIFSYFTLSAQPDYPTCHNDLFVTDTAKYFFISEIKPFGPDRFVELYNCRDSDYTAGMVYASGMYSVVIDSFANVTIPTHDWSTLTLPAGLFANDAIRILCRTDTNYKIMDVVMYTIIDSTRSIGLCDWFHETPPSPGVANICSITNVYEVAEESEKVSLKFYDFIGRELSQPRGLCIAHIVYKNGRVVVRKIARAYD